MPKTKSANRADSVPTEAITPEQIGGLSTEALLRAMNEDRAHLGDPELESLRCSILTEVPNDDPAHPFHPESEKYVARALSAAQVPEDRMEVLRVSLRALLRWDRAARLAALDGYIAPESARALCAPLDAALGR